jgi:hypothetical protein
MATNQRQLCSVASGGLRRAGALDATRLCEVPVIEETAGDIGTPVQPDI